MSLPTTRWHTEVERELRPTEGFYSSWVSMERPQPVLTFLPTGYEPGYAYPLMVFFHHQGGSERQILKLAPRVSRRNYICLGLRGPHKTLKPDGAWGYSWEGEDADGNMEEYVFGAIEDACLHYNIHPDRIFLAGFCEGAEAAYRLAFRYSERFAGVAGFNGQFPRCGPLLRLPMARRVSVLMGHGIANALIPLCTAKQDYRLLYTAGLDVHLKTYVTTHRLHADMMRDLNRWAMQIITDPAR